MTAAPVRRAWVGAVASSALALACFSSTTSTTFSGELIITGTYVGAETGTNGALSFEDELVEFTLVQDGDSVSGAWAGAVGAGSLEGEIDGTGPFIVTFTMTVVQPCDGVLESTAEARLGQLFDGSTTVGIAGSYDGSYCDGDVESVFFVQLVR